MMILLTKLNQAPIAVNSDLIECIEETPDTVLTLTNDDKIVVQERLSEVIDRIIRYKRMVHGYIEAEHERRLARADERRGQT